MLNKRLMGVVPGCKKYIAQNVALQWCALAANIAMIFMLGLFLHALFRGGAQGGMFWGMAAVMTAAALVRFLCTKGAARAAFYASKEVKKALRGLIYRKLLRLGAAYTQNVPTAEVVQLAGEGTEQLETYFGALSAAVLLQYAGAGHTVCSAVHGKRACGCGADGVCAAYPVLYHGSAEICKAPSGQILGAICRAGRPLPGKPAGPYHPEDIRCR